MLYQDSDRKTKMRMTGEAGEIWRTIMSMQLCNYDLQKDDNVSYHDTSLFIKNVWNVATDTTVKNI
jgi:hypothetical protein